MENSSRTFEFQSYLTRAEAGEPGIQAHVGECYELGHGVEPDLKKAAFWYRRSVQNGDPFGQLRLAQLIARGGAVRQETDLALYWFKRAFSTDHSYDSIDLAHRYKEGLGFKKSIVMAYWLFSSVLREDAASDRFLESLENQLTEVDRLKARRLADSFIAKQKVYYPNPVYSAG